MYVHTLYIELTKNFKFYKTSKYNVATNKAATKFSNNKIQTAGWQPTQQQHKFQTTKCYIMQTAGWQPTQQEHKCTENNTRIRTVISVNYYCSVSSSITITFYYSWNNFS